MVNPTSKSVMDLRDTVDLKWEMQCEGLEREREREREEREGLDLKLKLITKAKLYVKA
jgi:hypothetical protein